ncbi:hypothetical protein Tco_0923665 [Tanacetum coccineum]|uniref:Uncharacterized protein n=1 Tax=Tanacetum coccineum TaxID=301880 RepID=A0ABQ5D1L6_9ASTR
MGSDFLGEHRETWDGFRILYEQEEANSANRRRAIRKVLLKEDFDGSDVEKEGDNNVSIVPDSVKEDVNVQAEEKGSGLTTNEGESVSIGSRKKQKIEINDGGSLLTGWRSDMVGKTDGSTTMEGCNASDDIYKKNVALKDIQKAEKCDKLEAAHRS